MTVIARRHLHLVPVQMLLRRFLGKLLATPAKAAGAMKDRFGELK